MKQPEVISLGTMLVEIMRIQLDEPFDQIGTFAGPFPSGDTPVYVNAVRGWGVRRASWARSAMTGSGAAS